MWMARDAPPRRRADAVFAVEIVHIVLACTLSINPSPTMVITGTHRRYPMTTHCKAAVLKRRSVPEMAYNPVHVAAFSTLQASILLTLSWLYYNAFNKDEPKPSV